MEVVATTREAALKEEEGATEDWGREGEGATESRKPHWSTLRDPLQLLAVTSLPKTGKMGQETCIHMY